MKKYFFMTAAAIAALCSCSKENEFEPDQIGKQELVFTATTMENNEATRATLEATNRAAWEVGDEISINGKTYSAQDAGTITTFKAVGEYANVKPFNAYFPASLYNGTTATLPATQTYEAGKFNMPMYASSTTTELQFYNLCAVLAIKVTSDDIATLKSIKVTSDKKLNGSFTVTDNKAVIGTDGTNAVVLESSTALTLTSEGTIFYIAIPAQEYMYLNIFLSTDGTTYTQAMATKKATGLGSIARSKMLDIDYVKNATKLWAGNLFIADCNVGATSPEGFGGYYFWGDSHDQKSSWTGDSYDEASPFVDTATELWGDNWRMPTLNNEFDYLFGITEALTTFDWTDNYNGTGIPGKIFKGIGGTVYENNSVFFPAAGYYEEGTLNVFETEGDYWTSSLDFIYPIFMYFDRDTQNLASYYPVLGQPVRAVLDE